MNPYYTAVAQRANHRCEYCKAPEVVFNFPFEVEHIIPLSRQGSDDDSNLALACRSCNLRKGNRISGFTSRSNVETRFFHPRKDPWNEHFQVNVESGEVLGETLIGEVTVESVDHKLARLRGSGPHPKSLSQRGRGTLRGVLAPLALLGEGLGVRARGAL